MAKLLRTISRCLQGAASSTPRTSIHRACPWPACGGERPPPLTAPTDCTYSTLNAGRSAAVGAIKWGAAVWFSHVGRGTRSKIIDEVR
jgi:hypothetical protein